MHHQLLPHVPSWSGCPMQYSSTVLQMFIQHYLHTSTYVPQHVQHELPFPDASFTPLVVSIKSMLENNYLSRISYSTRCSRTSPITENQFEKHDIAAVRELADARNHK